MGSISQAHTVGREFARSGPLSCWRASHQARSVFALGQFGEQFLGAYAITQVKNLSAEAEKSARGLGFGAYDFVNFAGSLVSKFRLLPTQNQAQI